MIRRARGHLLPAACLLALAAAVLAVPGVASAGQGHHTDSRVTVVLKLPSDNPESIAFSHSGTMYLSLFTSGETLKIAPGGAQAHIPVPGSPLGVRIAGNGDVYAGVYNPGDAADNGVWRIPGGTGTPVLLAAVPGFPNGLAFDRYRNVYVTDSFGGAVYRIAPGGAVTRWAAGDLLAGTTDPGPCGQPQKFPIGANGLVFDRHGDLLVANTAKGTIVRIRRNPDGSAGPASVFAGPSCRLWGADGLARDRLGNLYVAANAREDIVAIGPDGRSRVLADARAGDPLYTPSDVAFGPGPPGLCALYITNFAFFQPGAGDGGVARLFLGVPGGVIRPGR
jgi:sugar lactone lactonase YvrE